MEITKEDLIEFHYKNKGVTNDSFGKGIYGIKDIVKLNEQVNGKYLHVFNHYYYSD